jgi:predicted DNA-binding transcriptional regulator
MAEPASGDIARNRWLAIQAVRVAGVAMLVVGILVAERGLLEPRWVGYVLMAVGLIDLFLMPLLLARKWRSSPG